MVKVKAAWLWTPKGCPVDLQITTEPLGLFGMLSAFGVALFGRLNKCYNTANGLQSAVAALSR